MQEDRRREDIDYVAIGQNLRNIRQIKRLSVKEAAELTGIKPGVISALELNRRNIGLHSLMIFARAYGVSLDWIVFGSPVSTSPVSPLSPIEAESKGIEEETAPDDPYFTALRNSMTQMDETEKEFMVRLVLNAHSEFSIVRAKSK